MDSRNQSIPFPTLNSRPNLMLTWLLRIVFVPLIASVPLLVYALPAIFVLETPPFFSSPIEAAIFLIISYLMLTGLYWWGFQYLRKVRARAIIQIEVNGTGVHYTHFNGTTSELPYQDLTYSENPYIKDIHTVTPHKGPTRLKVIWKNPETGEISNRAVQMDTDIFYGKYTGNKSDLIGRFILGVHLFRPDLTVCDTVYSHFYINRDTYAFDKKSHLKVMIGAAIAIIVIVYLIYLFTQ